MEQLQLFDIEPIPERPDSRKPFVVGNKRANRKARMEFRSRR